MTTSQETLGRRIARLRLAKAATQERLARELNVSPQAISKWENDINYPDISLLPQLARFLDVTIDELLSGATTEEQKDPQTSAPVVPDLSDTATVDEKAYEPDEPKESKAAVETEVADTDESDGAQVRHLGLGKFFSGEIKKSKNGVDGKDQNVVRLGNGSKKRGLHIYVESEDGDVVDMCVPMALAKFAMKSGLQIGGHSIDKKTREQLEQIDIDEFISAAKDGESGTLINVVSGDGDIVKIWFD